jgi:PAS domain S-box-containing protein
MDVRKLPFLLTVSGILAFVAVNAVYDVPRRIELGEQAQLADRIQGDLRRPLLALEHAELFIENGHDHGHSHEHELTQFNDSVLELETLIERYRDAGHYNPAVAAKVENFEDSIGDWIARKRAEILPLSGGLQHNDDAGAERMSIHQLLNALTELGQAEAIIHQDIFNGYTAIRILQVSGAVLLLYLLALIIYVRSRRTQELMRSLAERKQAQDALVESRQMLELVLDSIPVRVFWKDRNSVYLGCNRLFSADAGLNSTEQIIGKDDFSMAWKEQAELYRLDDKKAIVEGLERINYEEPQTAPDGSRLVLRTSKVPLRDVDGNILGILGCYEDITERKRIEEELQVHRHQLEEAVRERTREVQLQAQIINQIHDSVVSTDLDGIITSWNKGAENLFGYSAKEAIGKPVSFVYPEEEHEYLQQQVIVPLKNKGVHETEVIMRRKDGSGFPAMLSLSMLHDEKGGAVGMIGYSLDITARKKAEAELLKQADALEATNQELGAFSYSVSHDLRAPLRAIDGFSQLLLDDYADSLDEVGKDYLGRVRGAAQRMAELIDALLDLSRVSRRELQHEIVDISAVADSAFQKLKEHDTTRSVKVTIESGLKAEGDGRLLEMVLDNLIGNAWKYTARLDETKIEVGSRNDGKETVFYVRDNGAGFDMQYADKLFGAFQRLHGTEFEGTGIGLATVLRVKRHGGRVWGEGEPGKGATFYFTLPSRLRG